ncbi:transposable element Tcb2 transposase [Trichonephila clavipes]|nr:transposable element Tcb2 transposase [Trichonephila clavipes]
MKTLHFLWLTRKSRRRCDSIICEKEEEQERIRLLEAAVANLRQKAGVDLESTCNICFKTKFADGIGHICSQCGRRCCARCGVKVPLRLNKIWLCILCRKNKELAIKFGNWALKKEVGPQTQKSWGRSRSLEEEANTERQSPIPLLKRHFTSNLNIANTSLPFWNDEKKQQPAARPDPLPPPREDSSPQPHSSRGDSGGDGQVLQRRYTRRRSSLDTIRNDSLSSDQSENPPAARRPKPKRGNGHRYRRSGSSESEDEARSSPSSCQDSESEDEVETLAYQLNEEAERTERPIRRLSKVVYGSTCADMQVDVMGECLSSIKHVVGTTSGCFYSRSNHWEKLEEGRSVTSVAAKLGIAHSIVSRLWRQFQTTGTAIRGFSSGRPRGTTPADDRYIVLQARRNRRQAAGEIARHTTQATGRPISRFTVARRLHGGGLFARRPVRCVPLTPAHRRRRSLWCREHRNWRDNEWGRVLFTDESRFSLSSDSPRILIWRERGSRNHPSNIIERDRYGGHGVLVWGGIMLGSRTDLHIFDAGSVNGTRYCNEVLLPYVRLFRGAMGLQFLFMDDNAPCHRTVAAEQLLESEDIERMDWTTRSPDLNPIEHVWDFLGRHLAARTLPPVTIRELRLALQDEWAAMPQQLIDTLILSMGRRCETCVAVREISHSSKAALKTPMDILEAWDMASSCCQDPFLGERGRRIVGSLTHTGLN